MSDQDTSPRPRLRIAIIGAGIAGLAAALTLRKRHDVTIYERNLPSTPEAAGGLGLGPNGTKMCKELGLAKEDIGGVSLKGFKTWNKEGKLIKEVEVEFEGAYGRADGIHSKTRGSVIDPGHPPPVPSGLSAYRFTMPYDVVQRVLADVPNPLHYDGGVYANMIVADDGTGRSMMMYPCRDLKVVYFAAGVPDSALEEETAYSWRLDGDPRGMMKYFHDFPPWVRSIMK
ncbi:FAD binding domain [Fusarium albosuccineum]|uniref:FAD binding domain n=1 Tax=Fusarium albosuccineum TaxID=1237068 RepID=A0A8H4LHM9_9HYPO|nr:FAD binding domain [Fusarium albosuccineum]